jgi:hypothetical protein
MRERPEPLLDCGASGTRAVIRAILLGGWPVTASRTLLCTRDARRESEPEHEGSAQLTSPAQHLSIGQLGRFLPYLALKARQEGGAASRGQVAGIMARASNRRTDATV